MRIIFKLVRRINKLIYRQRFEKIYYLKAASLLLKKEGARFKPTIMPSKLKSFPLPVFLGLLLLLTIGVLSAKRHLPQTPEVKAFNPQLSPAPLGSNYLYQNITNGFKVYLGDRLQETKPRVKFEEENSSAEFSLAQVPSQEAQLQNQDNKAVIYKNVWPGIDINYSLTEKGVKEEIIISNRDSLSQLAERQLEFNLNLKNAVPRKSLEGGTTGFFVEPTNGQYVFHIPQPFMVDARGNRSETVELKIEQHSVLGNNDSQSTYTITLIPDSRWLDSAFYPVTIDPSVVHDESSEFTGTTNRIDDEGSGTTPKLRTPYHELPADIHTVGLWHINETANDSCSGGQDACDSSGNGYHGTATGTAITTTNQKLGAAARSFNGSSDYLSAPTISISNNITVEAWVNSSNYAANMFVVQKAPVNTQWELFFQNPYLIWRGGSTTSVNCSFPTNGQWHHVAGVQSGTTATVYIDGAQCNSGVVTAIGNGSGAIEIGRHDGPGYYFNGIIDEVRISDVARTAEEIKQDAQRFPSGVYTSDTIDLTGGTSTVASLDSLEWTDNVSTPGATLDGWPNFKPVIIDNTQNSNTLTDHQTKVHVNYDSNMQADFDDLRFTSQTQAVSAYGSEAGFNSTYTEYVSVALLDSTHFVVVYGELGGDYYGHAKIGTVSGSTISYGDEYTFNSSYVEYPSVAVLDSTHFVVGYQDYDGDTYGHAKIGTVSGSTISFGDEYTFATNAYPDYISVSALDSTHFVVGYEGTSAYGQAKVGTVSGSTISYGSESTFNSSSSAYISVSALDSTHFVVGYRGSSNYGYAKFGTVSGSTISYGSESTFNSYYTTPISVAALDSTHFVVGYRNFSDDYGNAKIGTVSGSTISYGSKSTFNSASVANISLVGLDSSHFVVTYVPGDNNGHARIGTVSGSTISYGSDSTFNSAGTGCTSVAALDSTHFVVGYQGSSNYGYAKIGTVVNTNLDYWIETKTDGVEAEVWVEVDTIPASSLATIWMWYGNGGASTGSSGDNTFYFFDDFNDGSIDGNKWTTSGTVTESTGWARLNRSTSDAKLYSKTAWTSLSGLVVKTKTSLPNSPTYRARYYPSTAADTPMSITGGDYGLYYDGTNAPFEIYFNGAWTNTMLANNTNYDLEFIMTGTNLQWLIKETDTGTIKHGSSATMSVNATTVRYMTFRGTENDNSDLNLDYIYVRNYSSPEPITGVGADIEFQTRTSSDGSTWEAWKPTTNETQIDSLDASSWTSNDTNVFGTEQFTIFGLYNVDVTKVDDSRYFYAHYYYLSSHVGAGSIMKVDGTGGGSTTFNSGVTNYISNDTLTSSYGLITYQDGGNSSYGTAIIGSISGTSIGFGGSSEYVFNSAATNYTSVANLDTTKFVVGYEDDGGDDYGCAKIGTATGTSIAYGSEYCFNEAATQYVAITALDSTHFVVAYQDDGGSDYGCAKVGTVSGSDISYGSEYCFNNASTAYIYTGFLNSSHFVVAYQDTGNSSKGTAIIGTYTGSAISYGSEYVFNDATTTYVATEGFDGGHFVVAYRDEGNSNYGTVVGGTIAIDSSISYSSEYVFKSTSTDQVNVTTLDRELYVTAYREPGGYDYLRSRPGWLNFSKAPINKGTDSTIKMEGSASNEITVGAPQPDFDTRGLWHLEETGGSSSYIQDETSLGNDLSVTDTASVVDGIFGKARDFDGDSGYLSCTDANCGGTTKLDYPGSGGWSVGAWVKLDTLANGADQQIAIKWYWNSATDNGGYVLQLYDTSDVFRFGVANSSGSSNYNLVSSTTVPSLNQWYHVVGVYNGLNIKIFVNGNLENSAAYSGGVKDISQNFLIGNLTAHYLNGAIDEPFVTTKALTSEEINEAYRAGRDHRLQKTISSTDLSGKTKVPFYFAADKQGTIAETYIGETDQAVYGVDSSTVALWHLDENHEGVDWEGYNSTGTVVDDASVGTLTWSNPSYAKVSDDSKADASYPWGTAYTHYLKATNFGFNIPSNAKILGIRAQIERSAAYTGTYYVRDEYVRIVKAGSVGSTDKAATGTNWPTSDAYASYGGSTDIWGETWTPADINASNFGVVLSAEIYGSIVYPQYARVDHMRIDVWYATIKDESGNGNMAKSRGDVAWTSSGKIGGARYFDGTDDYLQLPDIGVTEGTAYTVDFWAKRSSATSNPIVYSENTPASWSNSLFIIYYGDTNASNGLRVYYMDSGAVGGSIITTSNISVVDGQWHHVAFVQSSASNRKLYLDGKEVGSDTTSRNALSVTNAYLGAGNNNGTMTQFFSGTIDEVRVSNINRSTDEIRLAYQYGIRTHQITADYVTTAGSDGPTSTSDLQFTPDSTTGLYKGDTVIVRENYNGTNYIMQGEVSSISSGLVTVASWSGTAPSGGYTTNADVFKWQREYWDLKDISPADRNATVRLGLRVLDASEGFTMYLDDFRNNTNYLTDNLGSTITSTANRYIQYRAILSTNNTALTPELTSVTLDYNRAPTPPTSLLTEGLTNPIDVTDLTPEFSAVYNDDDTWDIANKYRIQVDDDPAFGSTIWDSGAAGTAMNNCVQGDRCQDISYAGSAPTPDTKYYWRIKYWDDQAAEGDWSTETAYFTVALAPPANCVIEDGNQPSELTVRWDDMSSNETGFRVEKNIDAAGFNYLTDKVADSTSHLDNTTSANHTYQYRVRAEAGSTYSLWCTTSTVDLSTAEGANEGFRFEGVKMEGLKIE